MPSDSHPSTAWQSHDDGFQAIIGTAPALELLLHFEDYPFAHEAGVFFAATNELFITSNQYLDPATNTKKVQISKIVLSDGAQPPQHQEIDCDVIHMANGGINYLGDKILFCAQGSMTRPSGLFVMEASPPYRTNAVVTDFLGRPFNSVNDVVVHRNDGSIWFTDSTYGHEQGYRPPPRLPSQVYRYDPAKGAIRAVADGFGHPNGLCFSPDEKILYVTDTDWIYGDGSTDDSRVSAINRRLFAMVDTGIPDGIKCDLAGNVYSGCGDGVNVWSPGGILLGKILVDGGAANFCFGRNGDLFILNETRLWRAQLGPGVKGTLLGI